MYTVLTGQKKNIGDFIITDRARALLTHARPEHELFQLPHWEPVGPHLEKVNQSSAVIIMGGPGYQPGFYPKVYKLLANPDLIKPPIIPMGLGWKGASGAYEDVQSYHFTKRSLSLLQRISGQSEYLGCRDHQSVSVLRNHGIPNALMTGCPVWYHIDSLGKPMTLPTAVNSMVYTPAQKPELQRQSLDIMEMLARIFPGATRYCSFHRGLSAEDPFTPAIDQKNNAVLSRRAEELGYEVRDTAYSLDNIAFYDDCDLHVGYRVHGHLFFLSKRKPSFLLHEDGRGAGVSEAINVRGIEAFRSTVTDHVLRKLRFGKAIALSNRTGLAKEPDPHATRLLEEYIRQELQSGFTRFAGVAAFFDAHYPIMERFLRALP